MIEKLTKSRKKSGFTLIELLVVISIIAVLMAIMMPALRVARDQAQRRVCGSNLRQIGIATAVYVNDHNFFWHDYAAGSIHESNYPGDVNYFIRDASRFMNANMPPQWVNHGKLFSMGYLATAKAFYCPTDKNMKYEDYFEGDEPKSARSDIRGNYLARNFNMIKGNPLKYYSFWDKKSPKFQVNGNIAILSDRWTYGHLPVHSKKYLNALFGDGRVESYDDSSHYVVGLGIFKKQLEPGVAADFKSTYVEAMKEATERFGSVSRDLEWAAGWLFLDRAD